MAAAAWRQINANAGLVTLESRVKQVSTGEGKFKSGRQIESMQIYSKKFNR